MAEVRDHVAEATAYTKAVVAGKIPACKWTKLACKRQLADRKRWAKRGPYRFDAKAATDACEFLERLYHVKGEWAKRQERIRLEPWQSFIQTTVFGWVHRDTGLRRFRLVYEEVARKNAKSTKLSGTGLYMLAADGEEGAEVYSAATTRDQARIVFRIAQSMARKDPVMRAGLGIAVGAHNINVIRTGSKFEALSAEGSTMDGLNTHYAGIDELHAHKSRAVYDVIETSMGSRSQPLLWMITTAGFDRSGICYEQRTYLTKILDGVVKDETYFGIIYTIDDEDDWADPEVWKKANPNLGVSVYEDDMARLCRKAQEMPSAQNSFLTKRLNVWVNADVSWMDMRAWERCADPSLDIEDFTSDPCWVGIDLASKVDMAAMVCLFRREIDGESHYYAFGRYYLPEETVEHSPNSQYHGWSTAGLLTETPGSTIDFGYIEEDLKELAARYSVEEVPFDPYQATQMSTRMLAEGLPMVEMRPIVLNFSEPMKEIEALVLDGRFHFDGDPVLTWMVSNVVCHLDAKDNIYPRKERPENKIDGVIALIMALGRAIVAGEPVTPELWSL